MSYAPWGQIHAERRANEYAKDYDNLQKDLDELQRKVDEAIQMLKDNLDNNNPDLDLVCELVINILEGGRK